MKKNNWYYWDKRYKYHEVFSNQNINYREGNVSNWKNTPEPPDTRK